MKKFVFLMMLTFSISCVSSQNAGTFTDERDGQEYQWVRIGDQIWMAENLNYQTTSGSRCYDNDEINCEEYGRLYDSKNALEACPDGWHLPSDSEWTILISYLGGGGIAGGKLKEAGAAHWNNSSNNETGTNEGGFTALPGGQGYPDQAFSAMNDNGLWWSSTEINSATTWGWIMFSTSASICKYENLDYASFSIRCIKDSSQ